MVRRGHNGHADEHGSRAALRRQLRRFRGCWRQRKARKQEAERAEIEAIAKATWAIFEEIAGPLVADGLAELTWPTLEAGPWLGAEPTKCAALTPEREGAASVWVEPVGNAWIDVAVGEPFPGGLVDELLIDDGWEDQLRARLQAVVEGRYRERRYRSRLGEVSEMIFDLPGDEPETVTWTDISRTDPPPEHGETTYAPYRR